MHPLRWLARRDHDLAALRRAARTAIVMPAMFALGDKVLGNPEAATFAAFGSFALLLLVGFGGPMRQRLMAQAALSAVGAIFVIVGTLASGHAWLAAIAMAIVGFGVIFAGVVSSVLAGATTSLLLAFILPVAVQAPPSAIPARLEGWGLAAGASFLAVALLWPQPARDPLRGPVTGACRALAARIRSDVALMAGGRGEAAVAEHRAAVAHARDTVAALSRGFLATPYRPTGLSTADRAIVRLVDELKWLDTILMLSLPSADDGNWGQAEGTDLTRAAYAVKSAAASVLEHGADRLDSPAAGPQGLRLAMTGLREALDALEQTATTELPVRHQPGAVTGAGPRAVTDAGGGVAVEEQITEFVTSLDLSFRAQELAYAVSQIARNIHFAAAAEQRGWLQRLLGREPADGLAGLLPAATQRAASHVQRHSVWLHNSVRGAVGLGLAVLLADLTGVQHSFWVVLGTLSVLRSNALNTGQNVVRGLVGTTVGVAIGAGVLAMVGTNTTLLWALLPVAILLAGVAPAVISFAAGQAAFTLTLVILFNIIDPAGWRIGLLRIEDIALGCAVSVVVGILFWPRGAGAALGEALADAYRECAAYLTRAVEFGMLCCDYSAPTPSAPSDHAARAAAASRRLDDTFRSYLAERGAKLAPLADTTAVVSGVVALRLAGDAVLDLWQRDGGAAVGDREAARQELLQTARLIQGWYDDFAGEILGRGEIRDPLPHDKGADARFVEAVRHDLRTQDGQATATAVRMIWTADHLDAARRVQPGLVGPARVIVEQRTLSTLDKLLPRRQARLAAGRLPAAAASRGSS
jgi:uncharacterized membrane protein YccC